MQYDTFKSQTIACSVIYIPTLILICVLVNFDKSLSYDPQVIFGNSDFNIHIISTTLMGVNSLVLSNSPDIFNGLEKCIDSIRTDSEECNDTDESNHDDTPG